MNPASHLPGHAAVAADTDDRDRMETMSIRAGDVRVGDLASVTDRHGRRAWAEVTGVFTGIDNALRIWVRHGRLARRIRITGWQQRRMRIARRSEYGDSDTADETSALLPQR